MDVRVAHSRSVLKQALLELLESVELQSISISQLCKAAEVSRPTFYQHFGTVDDVLTAIVQDRLTSAGRRLQEDSDVDDGLLRALLYLQEHTEELMLTLDSRLAVPRSREATVQWLRDTVARAVYDVPAAELDAMRSARTTFAVGGLVATFEEQLRTEHGAGPDAEELAASVRESMVAILHPGSPTA